LTHLTIDGRLITNSGIGVYIQNVISETLLSEFDVTILYNTKDQHFFKNLANEATLVPYNAALYSIKELIQTPLKTFASDIFWSPHYNVPLINFAKKLKIVTIHDVYHLAYYKTLSSKQRIYAKLMMHRAVDASDIVFTVSEFSKNEIIKFTACNPAKIHVVYNGVNFLRYNKQFPANNKAEVLLKYGITHPYILFVGNVKPHKNLQNALLGYKKFLEAAQGELKNINFVIAGKQEGFITGDDEIAKIITQPFFKENVIFTGWVDDQDLPILYQQASTFIFPSLYEGFGFPPLEAMAAGCPVVSSNAACLPEIYEDAVVYFDPWKVSSIAEALLKVLTNVEVRNELIQKGYKQSGKFTWDQAIRQKLNIITQNL
jgi:glycosyltransferase involved in cell wall biosynthesis